MLPTMLLVLRTRLVRGARLMAATDAAHPKQPHRYLMFLGVDPERQGSGLGGALIRSVLDRCDADGTPAYLENSNPRNTAFYGRHGFVERGSITLPDGAPPLVPMWRDPR